ncbi:MAG: hypothetical protein MHM6MM_005988 [Cercozoa sp. M6MM]
MPKKPTKWTDEEKELVHQFVRARLERTRFFAKDKDVNELKQKLPNRSVRATAIRCNGVRKHLVSADTGNVVDLTDDLGSPGEALPRVYLDKAEASTVLGVTPDGSVVQPLQQAALPCELSHNELLALADYLSDNKIAKSVVRAVGTGSDDSRVKNVAVLPFEKRMRVFHHRKLGDFDIREFSMLLPGKWLNDNLVNAYTMHLSEQWRKSANGFFICDSFFLQSAGKAKESKRKELLEAESWVIPHCEKKHWFLLVVANVQTMVRKGEMEDEGEDRGEPVIYYLDSLGKSSRKGTLMKNLRSTVSKLFHAENVTFEVSAKTLPLKNIKVPEQTNTSDCGPFVLQFIQDLPNVDMTQSRWFTAWEQLEHVGTKLRLRLLELLEKQSGVYFPQLHRSLQRCLSNKTEPRGKTRLATKRLRRHNTRSTSAASASAFSAPSSSSAFAASSASISTAASDSSDDESSGDDEPLTKKPRTYSRSLAQSRVTHPRRQRKAPSATESLSEESAVSPGSPNDSNVASVVPGSPVPGSLVFGDRSVQLTSGTPSGNTSPKHPSVCSLSDTTREQQQQHTEQQPQQQQPQQQQQQQQQHTERQQQHTELRLEEDEDFDADATQSDSDATDNDVGDDNNNNNNNNNNRNTTPNTPAITESQSARTVADDREVVVLESESEKDDGDRTKSDSESRHAFDNNDGINDSEQNRNESEHRNESERDQPSELEQKNESSDIALKRIVCALEQQKRLLEQQLEQQRRHFEQRFEQQQQRFEQQQQQILKQLKQERAERRRQLKDAFATVLQRL